MIRKNRGEKFSIFRNPYSFSHWKYIIYRSSAPSNSKGRNGIKKFSPSHKARQGWKMSKPCMAGVKIPFFGPAPHHCHPYMQLVRKCNINII